MLSINYCEDCNVEFKVQHDANQDYFHITHCPFCGSEIDIDEQYEFDESEDEE